ncbi:MAG: protein translocase subunit SecF [Bacillota bacterium]|nr:protein translocase subunit SecF [Bacillota bacterium]
MVDLMGKKKYFFILSAVIIIAGIVALFVNGLQLDISFQGGTVMDIPLDSTQINQIYKGQTADQVKNSIITDAEKITSDTVNKIATAQLSNTYNSKNTTQTLQVLTVKIADKQGSLNDADLANLSTALKAKFKFTQNPSISNVSPSIGSELLKSGVLALVLSSLCIVIYIWIRFRIMSGPSAGVMAVLAMIHDALIMLAVYTIFKLPVNEAFIAAVLTILGYSMNDTIIIYDRIRENSKLLRKTNISELVNKSIIQTLNRSINTVVTVLICLLSILGFSMYYNIVSIKDFILPLIVGIISGCYSSIFIASPLWVLWKESQAKKKIRSKPVKA